MPLVPTRKLLDHAAADIRLPRTGAIRRFLAEHPSKFDSRDDLKPARQAAKAICKQRYEEFGCTGRAAGI